MDVLHAAALLENRILSGQYGASGSRFPSVRALAADLPCSYVTAVRTTELLRERGLLLLCGRTHYVTTGRCAAGSALETRLQETRRPCFGVLFNSIDNHYYSSMSAQLSQTLRARGYDMVVMVNDSDRELELHQLDEMLSMGLSGVFFFPHHRFKNLRRYECYPLPVVAIGRSISGFSRSTVTVDNYMVGQLAANHLLNAGCASFVYLGPANTYAMVDMRLKGFAAQLRQAGGLPAPEHLCAADDGDLSQQAAPLLSRLRALPRPVGVFCYHDLLAASLLRLCAQHHLRVPEDLGIIGCDDLPITAITVPTLSTVHYPYSRICQIAADMMLSELHAQPLPRRFEEVTPRLIERQSTAIAPKVFQHMEEKP